jgi:hypothetical protein
MTLAEDFRKLRKRFFGTIFLIPRKQHNVLPLARPIAAFVSNSFALLSQSGAGEYKSKEGGKELHEK